ncbi:MAG: hypothetical protein EOO27_28555, partial [Comamonadaceae bacterium]
MCACATWMRCPCLRGNWSICWWPMCRRTSARLPDLHRASRLLSYDAFPRSDTDMPTPFACAPYIKTIGRGARGARGLDRDAARTLYAAILDGRVSDLELGAVLLAYRIKSESAEEIAGMLSAAQAHLHPLAIPEGRPAVTLAS